MEMSDGKILSPSNQVDVDSLLSQFAELESVYENSYSASELSPGETEKLLYERALEVERKITRTNSEFSDISLLPAEDLDKLLEHLKTELSTVEAENAKVDELWGKDVEDYRKLGSELGRLSHSLQFIELESLKMSKGDVPTDSCQQTDDESNLSIAHKDAKFKMRELNQQIEKSKTTLKTMQNLKGVLERLEAVEKFENALTGVRVIEFEENCIRLSLKTYIPNLGSVLSQQKIEGAIDPLEQNHELIIETVDETLEPKNVEIFPNDVYIGDIVDAAKSFRQLHSPVSVTETRSSLECFVRWVQDRITLVSLRRFVVKNSNTSRHSIEYLDREDIIVAHMMGGIDAFIKLPQGWPIFNSTLELVSLKNSSQQSNSGQQSKEISLSFLCKIVEMANTVNTNLRRNVSSFLDSMEEILMQQMREELQADNNNAGK